MNQLKLVVFGVLVFCVAAYMGTNTGKAPRQYKTYSKTIESRGETTAAPAPSPSVRSNQGGGICIGGICKRREDATPEEIIMAEQEALADKEAELQEALQKIQDAEQRLIEAEQRAQEAELRAQQLSLVK
jgi:hypothetical protein